MNRHTIAPFVLVGVMASLTTATLFAAPHVNQVHPPGNANAPVFIAVLADNYKAGEEKEFDQDVENFFKYGLLVDGYYKNQANNLKIVTYFDETPAGRDSIYDFTIQPNVGNCAVVDGPKTLKSIKTMLNGAVPLHTIILGNHPYNFGCTDDRWTYIAVDAVGTDVLPHEMGHILADLFDEWSLPINKSRDYDKVIQPSDTRNCWQRPAAHQPHWMGNPTKFPGASYVQECDLFGRKVGHPYDECRMGVHSYRPPTFCKVCAAEMDSVFLYQRMWQRLLTTGELTNAARLQSSHAMTPRYGIVHAAFIEQPAVTPDVPVPLMQVALQIDPKTGDFSVGEKTFGNGIYVPSYRRNGHVLYEYKVDGKMIEVGVIPDHVFTVRGYRGGATHGTADPQPREVEISIPNETAATIIDKRAQTISLYLIPDSLVETGRFITPLNFSGIRSKLTPIAERSIK